MLNLKMIILILIILGAQITDLFIGMFSIYVLFIIIYIYDVDFKDRQRFCCNVYLSGSSGPENQSSLYRNESGESGEPFLPSEEESKGGSQKDSNNELDED